MAESLEEAIEQAIQEALPIDDEQVGYIGNEPVFVLCRHLRGVALPNDFTFEDLKPYVRRWYNLSKDMLIDQDGEMLSFAECWAMFLNCWDKVKYACVDYLELAKKRAKSNKENWAQIQWIDKEEIFFLIAVCHELQQLVGDESFFLSSYDAAKILGKSQPRALVIMKMLEKLKILSCSKRGTKGKNGKASEYRYIYQE